MQDEPEVLVFSHGFRVTLKPNPMYESSEFPPEHGPDVERDLEAEAPDVYSEYSIADYNFRHPRLSEIPPIVQNILLVVASSGITGTLYQVLKTWIDARNGRKLKIKVDNIEVEATQMAEKDVLRIFELLQEKADRKKIRELLVDGKSDAGTGNC